MCKNRGITGISRLISFVFLLLFLKKSRIRETKHLSTNADSSTDAIGGWTKAKSAIIFIYLFFCGDFRPLPNKNIQMLDHFFPSLFSQGLQISKNIGHRTLGSGGKKTVKRYLKREKSERKKPFFCALILDNFKTKMFISETTSFHYFSPRIPNL